MNNPKMISRKFKLASVCLLFVLSTTAVGKEGPSESETVQFISQMAEKYSKCESTKSGEALNSSIQSFRLAGGIAIVSSEDSNTKTQFTGSRHLTNNKTDWSFGVSAIQSVSVKSKYFPDCGHKAELLLSCTGDQCVSAEIQTSSYQDGTLEGSSEKSTQVSSIRMNLASYEVGEKIVKAIKHLWAMRGLELIDNSSPKSEESFEVAEKDSPTSFMTDDPVTKKPDLKANFMANLKANRASQLAKSREQKEAELARAKTQEETYAYEDSYSSYDDDDYSYKNDNYYDDEPRPLSAGEMLNQIGDMLSGGAQDMERQAAQNAQGLVDQAAEQETQRQRRAEDQRRQAERRRQQEQERQEQQRAEAERQRRDQERQRKREELERLSAADNLIGSWASNRTSKGAHGEYHFRGGGGRYTGTFAGRASFGDDPLSTFRTTIRNLRVTHDGSSWNNYEGEANCQEWYNALGRERTAKQWEWIRIQYWPPKPDATPPEPAHVTSSWGCHFGSDPPRMTKR